MQGKKSEPVVAVVRKPFLYAQWSFTHLGDLDLGREFVYMGDNVSLVPDPNKY